MSVSAPRRPLAPMTPMAPIAPIATENRNLVIAEILEEGTRAELAWLAATVGREGLAAFVRDCGGRKLSARNRRFWSRALGVAEPATHPLAEQLWPLA